MAKRIAGNARYAPTPKTRVRRRPKRAVYDRDIVHRILDEALVAHVGFVADGEPRVLPTAIARIGEDVFVHGSANNHMLTLPGGGSAGVHHGDAGRIPSSPADRASAAAWITDPS